MAVLLSLFIVLSATVAILALGRLAGSPLFSVSRLEYVNRQLQFQMLLLGVAAVVLVLLYFVNPLNLSHFFALGNVAAPAKDVVLLGIGDAESWMGVGSAFAVYITLGTSVFIYLKYRNKGLSFSRAVPFMHWILLFSLTNSFSEEVVYRLGVIVPLAGHLDTLYILLISAVAFGVPHLRGMPNGVVGAMMAGFMGWLLAKSVVESSGIFWAWSIHFLQDVVIFTAFVMAEADNTPDLCPEERAPSLSE
jgi:uncharacterized protein